MPGNAENMFYTLEMGPVQMVIISTEFYYYLDWGTQMAINQYNWLDAVLKVRANLGRTLIPPGYINTYIVHTHVHCALCISNFTSHTKAFR